jgi:hypothetical protein
MSRVVQQAIPTEYREQSSADWIPIDSFYTPIIEVGRKEPIVGQPRRGAGDQCEFVADVMEAMHAGDQVTRSIGSPVRQRRFNQPRNSQPRLDPMEDPDEVHAGDIDSRLHSLVAKAPRGLDQGFTRPAAQVDP